MILLFILGILEFVRSALVFCLIPLYGQSVSQFSPGLIGTAIAIQFFLDNAFRIPSGWLIDKTGGKRLLSAGIFLAGSGAVLMYASASPNLFLVGAGLLGLGIAPAWPTVISGIMARMPLPHIGESLGQVFMAWLIGAGLGIMVINFAIGRSYAFAFRTLICLLAAAFFLTFVEKLTHNASEDNNPSSFIVIEDLYKELSSLKPLYPGMFVQTLSLGILMPVAAVYVRTVFGLIPDEFNFFLIGCGALTVLFLLPAGRLADRLGFKPPLISGFLLSSVSLALLPLQKAILPALVAGAGLGVAYSFILTAWNRLIAQAVSPGIRGTVWSFIMTVEGVGTAAGAYLGGIIWESYGYQAPFFVSAFILASMSLFYAFIKLDKLFKEAVKQGEE